VVTAKVRPMRESIRHATPTVASSATRALSCRSARTTAGLILLFATAAAKADLTITDPRHDALQTDPTITVRGTSDSDEPVEVSIGQDAVTVDVVNGKWSADLTLFAGLNAVTASSGGEEQVVLVTFAADMMFIESRSQTVLLRWSDAATEELKKIAVGTRQATLTPQQQNTFANSVKDRTRAFIAEDFSRFAVEIVETDEERTVDTHEISFVSQALPLTYGLSPHDCLNNLPQEKSKVYVGTFRDEMVNEFAQWAPMRKSDSIDERIDDVAYALARTASHELGHSLGLVTNKSTSSCGWMGGCQLHHSCESEPHALAQRFAHGRYIMDRGDLAKGYARIAEAKPQERSLDRMPAIFNTMNSDYLLELHPP
jgi:hypothetical protein